MICNKCGSEVLNKAAFCTQCGAKLQEPSSVMPDFSVKPKKPPVIYSSNPAVNIIKTMAASPMFLTAAIMFAVSIISSIIYAFFINGEMQVIIAEALPNLQGEINGGAETEILQFLSGFLSSFGKVYIWIVLFSSIPSFFYITAFFLIRKAGCDRTDGGMATSGFTIIKVLQKISIIISHISSVLFVILFFMSVVLPFLPSSDPDVKIVMIIFGITFAFVFLFSLAGMVLSILLSRYTIKTLNTIITTAMSGTPNEKISNFVEIMCYISGGISILSSASSGLAAVPSVLSGISIILFGVMLFNYKKQMSVLVNAMSNLQIPQNPPSADLKPEEESSSATV